MKTLIKFSLGMLVLAFLVLWALMQSSPYSPKNWTAERIGGLPLSKHAEDGAHNPNASLIQAWMGRKECKPILMYACIKSQQIKFACPSMQDPSNLNGLIVGLWNPLDPTVATGYQGTRDYWDRSANRDGCIGPMFLP